MITKCTECNKIYDDTYCLTYCPHESFGMKAFVVKHNGESKMCETLEELKEFTKKDGTN